MARTPEEKVIDRFLTLYIINKCKEDYNIRTLSETKLQKLVFFSEKDLIDKRYKAFNYRFIRLLHPTYSAELRDDLASLVELSYLKEPLLGRTIKTKMLLEDFNHLFENNSIIKSIIDQVLDQYAGLSTSRLIRLVLGMPWGKGTVKDLKMRRRMLYPLNPEHVKESFKIDENDFEDLMICFSPKISRGLDHALNEMRSGDLLSHAEVFG